MCDYTCKCSFKTDRPSHLKRHAQTCASRPIIIELEETIERQRIENERQRVEIERLWTRVGPSVVASARDTPVVAAVVASAQMTIAPSMALAASIRPATIPSALIRPIGQTSYETVTPQMFSAAIKNPTTAIASILRIIRKDPSNRNVTIPNKKEPYAKKLTQLEWKLYDRKEAMAWLVESIADKISSVADDDAAIGDITPTAAIDKWAAHHLSILNDPEVKKIQIRQIECVILDERARRDRAI